MPLFNLNQNQQVTIPLPIPVELGGTGTTARNFVDLTSNESIGGDKTFTGYTQLGDIPLKARLLTGNMPTTQGTTVSIPHGLNPSKIVAVSVMAAWGLNSFIAERHQLSPGYEYDWYSSGDSINIVPKVDNSAAILGVPIRILIWYTN